MSLSYGLLMKKPELTWEEPGGSPGVGMSWLLTVLFLAYTVICLRYRKNSRYFSMLFNEIVEVRERHNAFDDTVRETSFVWLLNLLWCGAAGVLLYGLIYNPASGAWLNDVGVKRLFICIGMMIGYTMFLSVAYASVGALFSDPMKASQWVKSYLGSQGLEGIALFPVALLGLCAPGIMGAMTILGIIIFFLAKILFIYKSFCIFFAQMTTWVLFLYYLCSLEIVPVVLVYTGSRYFCGLLP